MTRRKALVSFLHFHLSFWLWDLFGICLMLSSQWINWIQIRKFSKWSQFPNRPRVPIPNYPSSDMPKYEAIEASLPITKEGFFFKQAFSSSFFWFSLIRLIVRFIYVRVCVCIYEMNSSYTWYNSCKITHFLHHRFIRDLTAKKIPLNVITFHLIHN